MQAQAASSSLAYFASSILNLEGGVVSYMNTYLETGVNDARE